MRFAQILTDKRYRVSRYQLEISRVINEPNYIMSRVEKLLELQVIMPKYFDLRLDEVRLQSRVIM